jgi:hypothetical protein
VLECNFLLNCKEEEAEDEDCPDDKPEIHVMVGSPLGWGYLPTIEDFNSLPGTLHTRDTVLRKITREGLRRPAHNLERRRLELHDLGLM